MGNVATITFSDLIPNQTYSYWLFGLRDSATESLDQIVLVNDVSFNQTASASSPGLLVVNSEAGTDTRTLQSYGISITADALGQITTTITPNTDLFAVAGIAIEEPDIPPTTPEPSSVLALLGLGLGALVSKGKKQV